MDIVAFIPQSQNHWPGKKSAVVFTPGCNFRCGYCHNYALVLYPNKIPRVDLQKFFSELEENLGEGKVEGVVVSGGEPTLQGRKLIYFLEELKAGNIPVKLDTNGSNPEMLEEILQNELVDFISLEVKTQLDQEKYSNMAGVNVNINKIYHSLRLVKNSGLDYEIKVTFVPKLHTPQDIKELTQSLGHVKALVLQQFNALSGTLDHSLERIGLGDYDELLSVAKSVEGCAHEIRLRTIKGEEIVSALKTSQIRLKK